MKRLTGIVFAVCTLLHAAGVMANPYTPTLANGSASIERFDLTDNLYVIEISCTAKSDGTLSNIISGWNIDGILYEVETDPGSPAPQANYDLTLVTGGIDVMGGNLANRHTTTTERVRPAVAEPTIMGPLTLTTTGNNVNGAQFVVRIYIKKQ